MNQPAEACRLETRAAGTGRWFPLVIYYGNPVVQRTRAADLRSTLRHLGLKARITDPLSPDHGTGD